MNETLVTLNIHIPPSQETVICTGFLMENINLVKVYPVMSLVVLVKSGQLYFIPLYLIIKRSDTCKKLLSFGSKLEFCKPCGRKQ